jgi:hypothetical protein
MVASEGKSLMWTPPPARIFVVHLRPHLAFWRSTPGERLSTTPGQMTPDT